MEYQAEQILQVLFHEQVTDLVVLSHSMGSPIAYYLINSILKLQTIKDNADVSISVLLFVSVEGNIDENDTFFSGDIASTTWPNFSKKGYKDMINSNKEHDEAYYETVKYCNAWDLYASSIDLIKNSKAELTLPLLRNITSKVPTRILYGEKNKQKFTSESLLKTEFIVEYIPDSGHNIIVDNPKDFWKIILNYIINIS